MKYLALLSTLLLAGCMHQAAYDHADEVIAGAADAACFEGKSEKLVRDINRHTRSATVSVGCE